ncbi:MAG: caspase family protein, partial [Cyanobacteria bacterium J06635_1]
MKRYALIVGIGEYKHLTNLSKPASDAQAVHDLLKAEGDFQDIQLLNKQVTEDKLKAALKTLLLQRAENNDLLLYFTGHGFSEGDEIEQKGVLATYDCQVTFKNGAPATSQNGIPFSWLNGLIKKASLSSLVMFLDCCQSEFFIENTLLENSLGDLAKKNCFVAAACRTFEKAYALKSAKHSFFTGALLEALQSSDNGKITTTDVLSHTENKLRGEGQEPVYLGRGSSILLLDHRQQLQITQVSEVCPYQGLKAFTRKTRDFFYGRAAKVSEIFDRLDRCNFVPVVGPSGIGKSSVVRAGLLPQLEDFGWQVLVMKPDDEPLTRLRRAIKDWLAQQDISTREQQRLCAVFDQSGLIATVEQLPGETPLLLLIDQFEEVFTLRKDLVDINPRKVGNAHPTDPDHPSDPRRVGTAHRSEPTYTTLLPDEQTRFLAQIIAIGEHPQSRLKLITTMRADFIDPWLTTGQPPSVVQEQTVYLGPLQGQNLRDAIVKPAERQGYRFGEGLLPLILKDVEAEPNSLPLLEFALTELWEQRDAKKRVLTAAAYGDKDGDGGIGGLKGALNKRAEAEYAKLQGAEQTWIKQICLALVRLGRGEKDTRRRRPKSELLDLAPDLVSRETIDCVIRDFVKGRLLVTDGDDTTGYVDIAHEALMTGWQRFADWRQENRDQRRLVQRLEDAYEEWLGKPEDVKVKYLLQGGLLEEWRSLPLDTRDVLLPRPELRTFFTRSDTQDQENASMLKQALAEAHLREASRKIRDKLTDLPKQTVEATLSAISTVGDSLDAFHGEVKHPAQDALHRAFIKIRERLRLEGHTGSVTAVAFSPEGDRIVSGSNDNTLRLWDREGNPVGDPLQGHTDSVWAVAFSPEGDRIVSGSDDTTLRLWD